MIRKSVSLLAALLLAGAASVGAQAQGPVRGVAKGTATVGTGLAQGTAQAGTGVARGTVTAAKGVGQAGAGVAKGTATVAKKTGKGVWCIVTLGFGCR
jgi:hypothetical protein